MKPLKLRNLFNSLRFKAAAGVMFVLIPAVLLLIYNNLYAVNTIRNQVAESNSNFVSLYIRQIDSNLDDVNKYLNSLIVSSQDLQIIESSKDEDAAILAIVSLNGKINQDVQTFKSAIRLFVFSSKRDYNFYALKSTVDWNEVSNIQDFIKKNTASKPNPYDLYSKGWQTIKLGDKFYLLRLLSIGDTYIGGWISADSLLADLNQSNFGINSTALLATDSGTPMEDADLIYSDKINLKWNIQNYYLSGENQKYLIVGEKSAKGNFGLFALSPDEKILQNFPYVRGVVIFILIASILMIPLYLLFLRKIIMTPLNRLLSAMRAVRGGNLETRIILTKTSDEFQALDETFNNMVEQIVNLKINVYEEQLSKQKTELEHLQLQVNPHFFLNSLSIIHNLAHMKNFKLIQDMVECLVKYFRYMFRSNATFVKLSEELEHVENYLHIQQLRLKDLFTYKIIVPEFAAEPLVPPLVVQSFVENSIKYGLTIEESMHVTIKIIEIKKDKTEYLSITIEDTGIGFSDEVLEKINAGERLIDEYGEHIGVWNVQRRLQILYSGSASIKFYNQNPHGAVVEIEMPYQSGYWR